MPPARTSPVPKDSRAARAARRDRVVLAEIELWRSVAGQMSMPLRRSSAGSTTDGSVVDENGSVAGTEEDPDDETRSVASASTNSHRRPLRPRQQTTSVVRREGLRPLPSRTLSFGGFDTSPASATTPEIRSLELQVNHMAIVESSNPPVPSTPRRRSRLRL
ncbi:hypothetical protein RSOLAG1IB_00077 [Rhizoctonia solani AG-1 IB]|uniref:Uncharacterized protein n=1 Tax=Thanatephorus cucumeris (strain AG1-IB / isolate 7/3/14) TaxID=1108050 RepID=A0A0B7F5Q6_THACB|nr:hypothetical protein RSOLAG1IB_00077 [Rhizoctonia solani AG-1 IB]